MDIDFSIRALKLSANQAMVISSLTGMAFSQWWPDWHPTTVHHIGIYFISCSTHFYPDPSILVLMGITRSVAEAIKLDISINIRDWLVGWKWAALLIDFYYSERRLSLQNCARFLGERGYNHVFLSGHPYLSSLDLCWPSLIQAWRGPSPIMVSIHQASLWPVPGLDYEGL